MKSSKTFVDPFNDYWHTYNISGILLHVYSAFYDDREKNPVLRLNAAVKGRATVRILHLTIFLGELKKVYTSVSRVFLCNFL